MRTGYRHSGEDADLQADVMRFMAIVAFCLIAILAMVRQTSPSTEPVTPLLEEKLAQIEPVVADPEPEVESTPIPAPASVPGSAPNPQPVPAMAVPPTHAPTPAPTPEPGPAPLRPTASTPEPIVETPQQPMAAEEPSSDPGLTLRFASERDFLRLVARGKVTVYAYDQTQFLSLDRNHRFHAATPPTQVYELDAGTIPALLRRALPDQLVAENMVWAVALPTKVQQQIQQFVSQVDSGELHINRYQEVRHVQSG